MTIDPWVLRTLVVILVLVAMLVALVYVATRMDEGELSATTDRYPWYADVRRVWSERGFPEVGEKVCRAWDAVFDRDRSRDGVVDAMPVLEGDRVFVVLLGDLDEDTYRVIERKEVVL